MGILLTAGTLAYSSSTKLVMSWKNPKYSGEQFHTILVIGMSENPVVRADFEDALSSKITRDGFEAVPSNAILPRANSPNVDLDYLKGQIHDNKIDAVIVSRLSSTSPAGTISFPTPTTAASTAITARFIRRFILRTICAKTPLFALKPICIP
jgi:hypothetical protein